MAGRWAKPARLPGRRRRGPLAPGHQPQIGSELRAHGRLVLGHRLEQRVQVPIERRERRVECRPKWHRRLRSEGAVCRHAA